MGAQVIDDGVVTFRFHCVRCDVRGEQRGLSEEAQHDLHSHWMTWHVGRDGEATEYDGHWSWYCRGCMADADGPQASSEAEALLAGYNHWLMTFHHQGEFVIEQVGTYDPDLYDEDAGTCGYTEDHSGQD